MFDRKVISYIPSRQSTPKPLGERLRNDSFKGPFNAEFHARYNASSEVESRPVDAGVFCTA